MDSRRLKLPWGQSPAFARFAKFVNDTSLQTLLRTYLQEALPVRNKAEDLVSRVDALEKHFDSPPSDVAEQRHRSEVLRYAIIFLTVLGAESLPVRSGTLRGRYSPMTSKVMGISPSFSKTYERLYLTTRFARYPDALCRC